MKKLSNFLIYFFVGIVSFVFFLYLSFPYNVLKETIASELSNATGLAVTIKDLGPRPLVGLSAEGIKISSRHGKDLEIRKVNASLSLLSLLMFKVKANVDILDTSNGTMELGVSFGIFDLIGGNAIPNTIVVDADKLSFGSFAELALQLQSAQMMQSNPGTAMLLKPVLEGISVNGKLNAKIDFQLDASDFSRSKGTLAISLVDAGLDFSPGMPIPSQKFDSAVINASSQGGTLSLDAKSRLKTRDMDIALSGKIMQKAKIEQSILDIDVNMQFFQELKSQFGIVLNAVAGKETDGRLVLKISGPVLPSPEFKIL